MLYRGKNCALDSAIGSQCLTQFNKDLESVAQINFCNHTTIQTVLLPVQNIMYPEWPHYELQIVFLM